MQPASKRPEAAVSHRPRMTMVFAAAFVAGAAAAVGVNSVLDVRRLQAKPLVESEPIFVALRSLPQGAPVTVWDVGLRNWPKAMLPTTAIRTEDSFEGCVLRHPLREGQPLLSVQLLRPAASGTAGADAVPFEPTGSGGPESSTVSRSTAADADLWAPAAAPGPTAPVVRSPAVPSPVDAASRSDQRRPLSTDVAPLAPAAQDPAPAGDAVPQPLAVTASVAPPEPAVAEPAATPSIDPPPATGIDESPADAVAQTTTTASGQPQAAGPTSPTTTPQQPLGVPTPAEPAATEPTPAETAGPTPVPPATPPLVSVMRPAAHEPPAVTAGADDAAPPAGQPKNPKPRAAAGDGMVRYLVVPERIAREADTFFAAGEPLSSTPDAAQPPLTATQETASVAPEAASQVEPQVTSHPAAEPVPVAPIQSAAQPVPLQAAPQATARTSPPAARPGATRQSPAASARKPVEQAERPTRQPVANRPKTATSRQSQAPVRQTPPPPRRGSVDPPGLLPGAPPAKPEKQQRFGSVMSSITSGIESMVGGGRPQHKQRQRQNDYDEAVATDDPALLPAPLPR